MVKAAAGGGGIGMSAAADPEQLAAAFETARSRAERFFGSPAILLERYVAPARHVEVQILGLADGRVLALGERDCSVQRRHQKVAEETPSPGVGSGLRARMLAAAVRAGETVGYQGAGTVEFLVDARTGDFMFLEMNTRLQVEHPVTEMVTGIDLVEQQLRIAAGGERELRPGRRDRHRARDRAAGVRRGPGPVPAQPGHDHGLGRAGRRGHPGRCGLYGREPGHPVLRSAAGQAVRAGARTGTRRCAGPGTRWRRSGSPG